MKIHLLSGTQIKNHRKDVTVSRRLARDGPNPFPPVTEKTVMFAITTSSGIVRIGMIAFCCPLGLVDA